MSVAASSSSSSSSSNNGRMSIVEAESEEKQSEFIREEEKEQPLIRADKVVAQKQQQPDLTAPFQIVPSKFSKDSSPSMRSYLKKWNIDETCNCFTLRFLETVNFLEPSATHAFVCELFNSPAFRSQFKILEKRQLQPLPKELEVKKVNFKPVKTTKTDLHLFDRLWNEEESIVYGSVSDPVPALVDASESSLGGDSGPGCSGSGGLKKCFEDVVDGVQIADELHKAILDPSSDNYELFTPQERQELLFILFRHLIVGGGLNQYENNIYPYLGVLKLLYRDLLSIRTNRNTNQVEIANLVYKVDGIVVKEQEGGEKAKSIFGAKEKDKFHLCLLSVDTMKKHVTVYYFAHTEAW